MHWDKKQAVELRKLGFTEEQIMIVIGAIAEHRQLADREGYIRGYNTGYEDASTKLIGEK